MSFFHHGDEDPRRAARRPLLAFLLATLAVGGAASVFTEPNIANWYAGLVHPWFTPPDWLFAPVWTALYALMAVAAWRVWRATHRPGSPLARSALKGEVDVAGRAPSSFGASAPGAAVASEGRRGFNKEIIAYGVQLFLNFCWSGIFFGLHRMDLALADIGLLILAILACIVLFFRADRPAGLLLVPYLAWTGFAAALNYAFLALNP